MEWKTFLKDKDIKVTRGRLALLEILEDLNRGISAEDLREECKNRGVDLNLSTIYRSLELFDEKNIVKKVRIGDIPFVYSIKKEPHNHTVKCNICNKSIQVPCPMEEIEELIKMKAGFSLTEHKLEMKGICEDCKK